MPEAPAQQTAALLCPGLEGSCTCKFKQLLDPFFSTHSPASPSLAQTGPMWAEQKERSVNTAPCLLQGTGWPQQEAVHSRLTTTCVCCCSLSGTARPGRALPGSTHRCGGLLCCGLISHLSNKESVMVAGHQCPIHQRAPPLALFKQSDGYWTMTILLPTGNSQPWHWVADSDM